MNLPSPQPQKPSLRVARSIRLITALLCAGALLSVLTPAASAAAPAARSQTGTVEGRLFNAASGTYLNNARVTVEGTALQAFTSNSGEFQLRGVPAGPAKIKVNYSGQSDLVQTVSVVAGAVAAANFTFNASTPDTEAKTVTRDAFVVGAARYRNAQELATNEERVATNIKAVVALDSLGYVSDGNIGEFVRFLPGVDVTNRSPNPGNAAAVTVRGFGADSTAILVDGVPWPANPDASQIFSLGASAFRPDLSGRKGDVVAVSPDKVGPTECIRHTSGCDGCQLNVQANDILNRKLSLFAVANRICSKRVHGRISDAQTKLMPDYATWRTMQDRGIAISAGIRASF
jgi:hypothetical protein